MFQHPVIDGVSPSEKDEKAQDDSGNLSSRDTSIDLKNEIYDSTNVDPILARKMALVNSAIDEIGMTPFQWKLFFLNGFGYAVDSLLVVCQTIAQPAVTREYGNPDAHILGISMASQIGLLVGAATWGLSADVIGRKLAFNTSLFICAIFVVIAGAMPGYVSFSAMVAIYSAGAGGNFILDTTNLLEFLPSGYAWLLTFMATWSVVGYTVTGFLAWEFMSNFSCDPSATPIDCRRSDNMGWRYLHFTCGSLVIMLALLRLLLVRMVHTPKWLVSQNRDEEIFRNLRDIALKYDRPFSLTLKKLREQGDVRHTDKSVWSTLRLGKHFSALFETKKLGWSTTLIIANWVVLGIVAPLYSAFLPYYLASRGVSVGDGSNYTTWRNYAITQISGIFGPVLGGVLVQTKYIGRRGTLAIGAILTTVLQFSYTQIRTPAQNLGVSSAIQAASNIYVSVIYAYTPEVLPSAHRATGFALCVASNRFAGIVGILIGSYANVNTTVPLFICAALYGLLIILSVLLPFEPRGKRSV